MAGVTITYQGSTIAEISESDAKVLKTAGKFCTSDIEVTYEKPSNGFQSDIDTYVIEEPMPIFGVTSESVWDGITGTSGEYIDNDGNVVADESSITSPFISVSPGDVFVWRGKNQGATSYHRVHAFDSNGNWLFLIVSRGITTNNNYTISFYTTREDVAQIKLCCKAGDTEVSVVKQPYSFSESLWDGKTGAIDGYINPSGEIVAPGSPPFVYSPLIPISAGDCFVFCGYGVYGFVDTFRVHGYNNGTWVEQINSVRASGNDTWFSIPIIIQAPVNGVRITCSKASKEINFVKVG